MEDVEQPTVKMGSINLEDRPASSGYDPPIAKHNLDDLKDQSSSSTLSPDDAKARSDSASTPDTAVSSKQSRKSQKAPKRGPVLFNHLPDVTEEACETFKVIPDCLYGSKHMGSTDNDALDCDCKEEWRNGINYACGEDCINRATRVECTIGASGTCGDDCQNQRFQRKQYANVSVIKTEKKGFGLRANADLEPNDFVHEYIGEVINEPTFRRRMIQYDDEGIKHFYFMSLSKSEFVDATKKGNLGRFCNHSCNPNCYVDKWVVGEKLRMGIFVLRRVKAGEELTFNYNVDRYGADPQPCYCGESECVGFIGGKTQTERATKLATTIVEALGIDDADGWDTAVSKKPRKKRPDEDDEEYVNSVQAKSLNMDGARKVMAALMQCKEKWIAVKLLERIQRCHEERVLSEVLRMHAYQIMKTTLNTFIDDHNVILQVLDVLNRLPRLTKNKIVDSNIEATIHGLTTSENEEVVLSTKKLLEDWAQLNLGFRIKRRKVDPNNNHVNAAEALRSAMFLGREEEKPAQTPTSQTASPLQNVDIPKGPRNQVPQRNFVAAPRPRRPQFLGPLPAGWFSARDSRGNVYFYDGHGQTTWKRPTEPAAPPGPKQPTKAERDAQILQNIINAATMDKPKKLTPTTDAAASATPSETEAPAKESKQETWKNLPLEKQMKIYRNTIFPYIKPVFDKYYGKLQKDDLKKFAKELSQKFATSDFKNGRVKDPKAPLSEKAIKGLKAYVKTFLDRAVVKHEEREAAKARRRKQAAAAGISATVSPSETPAKDDVGMDDSAYDMDISPVDESAPNSPSLKRKREDENGDGDGDGHTDDFSPMEGPSTKSAQEDVNGEEPTPPPPPPPPEAGLDEEITKEQRELREQEEALMRENEEAQRLEDEAARAGEPVTSN